MKTNCLPICLLIALSAFCLPLAFAAQDPPTAPQFQQWRLPAQPPHPADNTPSQARIALGRQLFFDPRLSHEGNMSCASCHNPMLGWSDGLRLARGYHGMQLARGTPTIVNSAFNRSQMWDGRAESLEAQAVMALENRAVMNGDVRQFLGWMAQSSPEYRQAFQRAYPGEEPGTMTVAKAIASFERSLVSHNTPFDRWLAGDAKAMSTAQLRGLALFVGKASCAQCHAAPHFSDGGFYNIGLASFGAETPDPGRFAQSPIPLLKGAFKTPSLRDVEFNAPYFHDGSGASLRAVMEHYNSGGVEHANLSPGIRPLRLSEAEMRDVVAFLKALSSQGAPAVLPSLPQ
ncbi:MAG: cytochrome c peroxidase [Pseudomonadota bacterium]